jgi:hypothetical protein
MDATPHATVTAVTFDLEAIPLRSVPLQTNLECLPQGKAVSVPRYTMRALFRCDVLRFGFKTPSSHRGRPPIH